MVALLSSAEQRGPLRYLSATLGAVALVSLGVGLFGQGTAAAALLGRGGVERWVAYPVVLWLVAFGAALAARGEALPGVEGRVGH